AIAFHRTVAPPSQNFVAARGASDGAAISLAHPIVRPSSEQAKNRCSMRYLRVILQAGEDSGCHRRPSAGATASGPAVGVHSAARSAPVPVVLKPAIW